MKGLSAKTALFMLVPVSHENLKGKKPSPLTTQKKSSNTIGYLPYTKTA